MSKHPSPTAGENTAVAKRAKAAPAKWEAAKTTPFRTPLRYSPNGPAKPTKRRMRIYDGWLGQGGVSGRWKTRFNSSLFGKYSEPSEQFHA
jgi:hypothetical protein